MSGAHASRRGTARRRHRLLRAILSGCALIVATSFAPPDPFRWTPVAARPAPFILGVQTHFGAKVEAARYDLAQTAAAMRETGFDSWRDTLSMPRWSRMKAGSAKEAATYATLRQFIDSRNEPSSILNISDWPIDRVAPSVRFAAFAASLDAMLETFPHRPAIELWNEWDRGNRGVSEGGAADYAAFVGTMLTGMKRRHPDTVFLIGAAADDGGKLRFEWTRALLATPQARQADGISVHVYNHCSESRRARAAAELIGRLDGLRAAMRSADLADKPVYISEFGWPTGGPAPCLVPEDEAAANLVHFALLAAARPWIAGAWYYELKDSGTDPADPESRFGLYDMNYRPKPGVCAAKMVNDLLRHGTVTATYEGATATAVRYRSGRTVRTVIWATNARQPVDIMLTRRTRITPMCAAARTADAGRYRIGYAPVVVAGDLFAGLAGGTNTLR